MRALAPALLLLPLVACSGGEAPAEHDAASEGAELPAAPETPVETTVEPETPVETTVEPETTVEIVDLDGLEAALAERRGGMLLNFWALWCAPCVAELPELVEVGERFRAQGGRVVGVSYDLMVAGADPETIDAKLRAFLAKRDLVLDVLVYDEADFDGLNARYDLPGEIPVTLAIDAQGRVVDRQEGKAGAERFAEMMRAALGR